MITSLTDEQLGRIPEIREKWRAYGLSCEPADRERAELGIVEAYRVAGFRAPKIVWCGSPMERANARNDILENTKIKGARDPISMIPGGNVTDEVFRKTSSLVRSNIWRNVKKNIWYRVTDTKVDGKFDPYHNYLLSGGNINSIWNRVGDRIYESIGAIRMNWGPWNVFYGLHDSDWLAHLDYFHSVLGLQEETEEIKGHLMIAQSAGWLWPHEKICWVCERPESVHLDENEIIHNLSGPAISFRDGWKIYASHGVILPDWIIETPKKITPSKIDKEENAEIRRIMIEIYGQERYLKEGGSQLIGADSFGRLWKKELRDEEPIVMVELLNSTPEREGSLTVREAIATFGEDAQVNHDGMMMRLGDVPDGLRFKNYFLRVPPTCSTPKEAVAWTFNKQESEYELAVQS